jgi:hypothetical protein
MNLKYLVLSENKEVSAGPHSPHQKIFKKYRDESKSKDHKSQQKVETELGMVVHSCNSSYLGGGEDQSSSPAQAKSYQYPTSKTS